MGEVVLMVIGVEVGDGELHELEDDVLEGLLGFELSLDVCPILVLTGPHEVEQLYVVLQAPTRLTAAPLLTHFDFLGDVHLHVSADLFFWHRVVAVDAEVPALIVF